MKPKLPRALLWREKKSMDEMLKEPFCQQLLQIFLITSRKQKARFTGAFYLPILNEVYYQCTRVVYESNYGSRVRDYEADIKANLGGYRATTRLVLMLMMYLLMAQSEKSEAVIVFIDRLKRHYKSPEQYYLGLDEEKAFLSQFIDTRRDEGFFLIPEPCSADDLEGMVIDWQDVTRNFSKQAINDVLMLWQDSREQAKVLKKIETAFYRRQMSLFEKQKDDYADVLFFKERQKIYGDIVNKASESDVCKESDSHGEDAESYEELKIRIIQLEKRYATLETENLRLKSELNNRKQKSKQERSFTLSLIVDYCKKKCEWSDVSGIVAMLYKLIRKGSDEEEKIVDSIEEEFLNRKSGNTYNAPVGQVLEHVDKVENKSE